MEIRGDENMSQNGKPASSLIVGVVISLLVIALLSSSVTGSGIAGWVWIVALTVSAGLLGWAYSLHQEPWAAFGTYATGAVALFVFLVDKVNLSGVIVPVIALLAVAAPFFVWWRIDRGQVLALAIAYILVAAIPILLIQAVTDYEEVLITIYVLLAIGVALIANYRMSHISRTQ
jgi:hypothetical protein